MPEYLKNPPTNLLDEEGKKCYSTLIKNLNESARYWEIGWGSLETFCDCIYQIINFIALLNKY